jgi:hypothetical protein
VQLAAHLPALCAVHVSATYDAPAPLQAGARICKTLGQDFLPYLQVCSVSVCLTIVHMRASGWAAGPQDGLLHQGLIPSGVDRTLPLRLQLL